jgi:hypothetical protein
MSDNCSHWREGDSDNCLLCGEDLGPTSLSDVATEKHLMNADTENKAPDRIWIQRDTSFFEANGNGTFYREPDRNSIAYVRAPSDAAVNAVVRDVLQLIHHRYVLTFRKEEIKGHCPVCYPRGHFTKEPSTLREDIAAIVTKHLHATPSVPSAGLGCTCNHHCPSQYEREVEESECIHADWCELADPPAAPSTEAGEPK